MTERVFDLDAPPALRFVTEERRKRVPPIAKIFLLVLVVAAVAVPVRAYTSLRAKAVETKMKVALHGASVAMEGYGVVHDTYVGATVPRLQEYGYAAEPAVDVSILRATIADFSLRACATGDSAPGLRFESFTSSVSGEPIGCH